METRLQRDKSKPALLDALEDLVGPGGGGALKRVPQQSLFDKQAPNNYSESWALPRWLTNSICIFDFACFWTYFGLVFAWTIWRIPPTVPSFSSEDNKTKRGEKKKASEQQSKVYSGGKFKWEGCVGEKGWGWGCVKLGWGREEECLQSVSGAWRQRAAGHLLLGVALKR